MKKTFHIIEKMQFTPEEKAGLLQNIEQIKAQLEAEGRSSRQTIFAVSQIAEALHRYHRDNFAPRITCCWGAGGTRLLFCEPPCGSNSAIFVKDRLLFVDGGFSCYHEELFHALRPFIPHLDGRKKDLLLTHTDIDHCGKMDTFDAVWLNRACADHFAAERSGKPGLRELLPDHAPYVRISKLLARYQPPSGQNFHLIGARRDDALLSFIGRVKWDNLTFEVYEGAGGHVVGEMVYIERSERLIFSGDIYINVKDQPRRQKEYNRIAPTLLTSVDADPDLARREREALFSLLSPGIWTLFGGHGAAMQIRIEKEH